MTLLSDIKGGSLRSPPAACGRPQAAVLGGQIVRTAREPRDCGNTGYLRSSFRRIRDSRPGREPQPLQSSLARVPRWLPKATYVFVSIIAALALLAHSFGVEAITVDTTTLGLLAVLLLVPLAPHIRRLSAGGLEAEIGPHDAQQLQAAAASLPPAPANTDQPPQELTVEELIERDPPLGLAKIRIDLEREIRTLYTANVPDGLRRGHSLGLMTRELAKREILPPEIASPLMDVTALANRAVHGEYVPRDVAEDIADVGLRVLNALRVAFPDVPAGVTDG